MPKTDTSDFDVPAKLAGSNFLRDISTVSGKDFVGQDATAASLGLAQTYTINLLTSCAIGSTTVCSAPRLGYIFSPASDLKLDGTSLQGTATQDYTNALSAYNHISPFLSGAYVLSVILLLLSPLIGACASRKLLVVPAALLSAVTTILLLAAGITAGVTFRNLSGAINTSYGSAGLHASTGSAAWRLGYGAFGFSLVTTIALFLRTCYASPRRSPAHVTGTIPPGGGLGKKTFFDRLPQWGKHSYVQVEKQPAVARGVPVNQEGAAFRDAAHGQAEDDWAHEDEYTAGVGEAGIAMKSLAGGNRRTRDVSTAYEPYADTS